MRLEGRRSRCMLSFVGWFQARRQNKGRCSLIFKETNIRTHTTQQRFHGIQTHPLLVPRKELKKRKRRNNPGKNPKSLQTVVRDDSYLFPLKVSQLCHRSIHLLLWTPQKEKTRHFVLLSIPVWRHLPAGGGWPQVCNGGAILLLNWKKT